jgi:hypothetical protein
MKREARLLRRLRYETMDWCRQQSTASELPLTAHRDGVMHHPEVWTDD